MLFSKALLEGLLGNFTLEPPAGAVSSSQGLSLLFFTACWVLVPTATFQFTNLPKQPSEVGKAVILMAAVE